MSEPMEDAMMYESEREADKLPYPWQCFLCEREFDYEGMRHPWGRICKDCESEAT